MGQPGTFQEACSALPLLLFFLAICLAHLLPQMAQRVSSPLATKTLKAENPGPKAGRACPGLEAGSVKTRSNSFHSTLEPNTEVFSKVSRSLAQFTLVNSVSTLLNKGGSTCNCPSASQDF